MPLQVAGQDVGHAAALSVRPVPALLLGLTAAGAKARDQQLHRLKTAQNAIDCRHQRHPADRPPLGAQGDDGG